MSHFLKDTYQSVTDTIIAALEAGTPPWVHPWNAGAGDMCPANLSSGRHYRGINVLLLSLKAMQCGYSANRWMTYQQARVLGANVRKGEAGTEVVLYKLLEADAGAKQPVPAAQMDGRKVIPLIRSFIVFNAAQIDGLPEALLPAPTVVHEWQACEAAECILATSGANIAYGGVRAFYNPSADQIQLPERSSFATVTGFCQVALHELTHWTGAPNRCNRPLLGRQHIEAYAMEELIAELGSAFLTDRCGLPGVLQHASYIESWLSALRSDKRLIFTAAAQAQRAADYLLPPLAEEVQAEQVPMPEREAA
jgi:antirestriction protein ArdC